MKIYYHINQDADDIPFFETSSIGWYPRHGLRESASFDLTFHHPKETKLISVGDRVSADSLGEVTTSRWVTSIPINNAAFDVGYHGVVEFGDDSTATDSGGAIKEVLSEGLDDQIGPDITNSFQLFHGAFGDIQAKRLYVTQMRGRHGEAFPGLIRLSFALFNWGLAEGGYEEVFRAHEVAHQWWGIDVDFKTYHDQWLSEGLSTFCGLWYMEVGLRNTPRYFSMLQEYKRRIIENRQFAAGSGQQSGPIWQGYRNSSSTTWGDYNTIVYEKGAWVFHMLRTLMMDVNSLDDTPFFTMLKDFYTTYRGKKASTEDFKQVVEKHVGADMGWFFDQWVYGTAIPKYLFAYQVEETPEGKFLVHCKVAQGNVYKEFQSYIIMLIDFGNDQYARLRIPISGVGSQFDLPLLPLKPKKIILNDMESVLGNVEEVQWFRF